MGGANRWLRRHTRDPFVIRARREGWRSRASYKLLEIQDRFQPLANGGLVLDLGCAPGAWSQVAAMQVDAAGGEGMVIACDILQMSPIEGVQFVRGDFEEQVCQDRLAALMGERPLDVLLSDMSPNLSGVAVADQARTSALAEAAMEFAAPRLAADGGMVVKVFQGSGTDDLVAHARTLFEQVALFKPQASRARSREFYLVARQLRASADFRQH